MLLLLVGKPKSQIAPSFHFARGSGAGSGSRETENPRLALVSRMFVCLCRFSRLPSSKTSPSNIRLIRDIALLTMYYGGRSRALSVSLRGTEVPNLTRNKLAVGFSDN
jgi:hypothetical protein